MKITSEQRLAWAERTAQSPFNRWLADQIRGGDGRIDMDRLYELAREYGVDKRAEYEHLNPGQQRMNLGNALRTRVPAELYSGYQVDPGPELPQVFATRFWGFDPAAHPFAGFTHEGSRASLIRRARPGDLIAVVGTTDEPTAPEDRGRLLGLLQFIRTPMQAEDLLADGEVLPDRLFKDGRFRWPYAVPADRAWRFEPSPHVRDVIGRQLSMAATTSVDKLSEEEAERVLSLPMVEVELPPSRIASRGQRLNSVQKVALDLGSQGQPGPPPSEWSAEVSRVDGPTATYLMQFGTHDVWKIGISQNPASRCNALNFSVPSEVLDGWCWKVVLVHKWADGASAYRMEQALLSALSAYAVGNERVRASRSVIDRVWQDYLMGRL